MVLLWTLLVIAGLAVVLRWAYGSSRRTTPHYRPAPHAEDFGLLREVALVEDAAAANSLRAILSDAGIRSTVAHIDHGAVKVLVFSNDLDRARHLVGPS